MKFHSDNKAERKIKEHIRIGDLPFFSSLKLRLIEIKSDSILLKKENRIKNHKTESKK